MGISREKVLAMADAKTVALNVGCELSNRGTSRMIGMKCPYPEHDDHKFGNCYLYPNDKSFYCFACHNGGNIIDLVMIKKAWSLKDGAKSFQAMSEIVDICGLPESAVSDGKGFQKRIVPPALTSEQEALIRLYNGPIYSPVNVEVDDNGDQEEQIALLASSQLTILRTDEPETYCNLVLDHVGEKRSKLIESNRVYLHQIVIKKEYSVIAFLEENMKELALLDQIVLGILEYKRKAKEQKNGGKKRNYN